MRSYPVRFVVPVLAAAALVATQAHAAPAPKVFLANLNAAQETPPVASAALGNAQLTFDQASGQLCFAIAYQGLGSAEILAHIHGPAPIGTPAGIVFNLPLGGTKAGCVGPLSSTQKKELLKNLYYINIHTVGFPGGEIRGQILRIK